MENEKTSIAGGKKQKDNLERDNPYLREGMKKRAKTLKNVRAKLHHAEEKLQASEEKYRQLVENTDYIIIRRTLDGRITFFNEFAQKFFGYTEQEVLGRNVVGTIVPEIDTTGQNLVRMIKDIGLQQERYATNENECIRKNGERVWIAWTNKPIRDEQGNIVEILCIGRDITDRKKTEKVLLESKQQLSARSRIAEIFLTVPHDEMFGEVLKVILECTKSKYGIFGYIDKQGVLVIPSMTKDVWEQCQVPDKAITFPRERWGGIWGRSLKEKRSLYANEGLHVPEGHIPITRVLVAPIMYGEDVIGLLEVANKVTDYGKKEQEFLETIAGHIAPVLNARLQRDRKEREHKRAEEALHKAYDELEVKVEERTAELNKSNVLLKQEVLERKRTEEVLVEASEIMEKIFSTTHFCIAYMDTDFNFIRVNQAYAESDGRDEEFFTGKNHFDLYPSEENKAIFQRVAETGGPYIAYAKPFVYAGHPERGVTYWDWTLHPVKDSCGKIDGLILCLVNVTERKRLEQEILGVIEKERMQIGREMHDSLGQSLTGIAVKSKGLALKLADQSSTDSKDALRISKLANKAITQMRSLTKMLCPLDTEVGGLPLALKALTNNTENALGVKCRFNSTTPVPIDSDIELKHLYRIAQEAVTNAVKHGKAKKIHISLDSTDDSCILTVKSDGTDFPRTMSQKKKGLGLRIMEYRAGMIGGSLDIRKADKGGTIVTCALIKRKD
jgi:PAS domain S-box-containing protein